MVSREAVVWAYRLILGRDPESDAVVEGHCRTENIEALRRGFFNSEEFASQNLRERLPKAWVITPVMQGKRSMWVDLGDRFVSFGCLFDHYEPVETRFVTAVVRPGDVFIDVGANVGWFTMLASTLVGEEGRVHAFEPRADTADHLEKSVVLNELQNQVTVHRFALSDAEGHQLLVWTRNTENPGGSFVVDHVPTPDMEVQPVLLRRLDDLQLERVDFIKVDVEGAEMRVFRGAQTTLERCRPVVLSELSPDMLRRGSDSTPEAVFSLFRTMSYRIFLIDSHDSNLYGKELVGITWDSTKPLANFAMVPEERFGPGGFADFKTMADGP